MAKGKKNHATRFKSKGVGVNHDHKPVAVMLPLQMDAYVRALTRISHKGIGIEVDKLRECNYHKAFSSLMV